MYYAKIVDDEVIEWPIKERELRNILEHISFPNRPLTKEDLVGTDYVPIPHTKDIPIPLPDKDHFTFLGELEKDKDGNWVRTYKAYEFTDPLLKEARLERTWKTVRNTRKLLLEEADIELKKLERYKRLKKKTELTIKQLDAYIETLCDVTEQDDPFHIVWPLKPF